MYILAWDTSSKEGTVSVLESIGDQVRSISEWNLDVRLVHSEKLLWAIHQSLEVAELKIDQIDLIGVGVGPGSFTGLRVGLTTARTIASELDKPLMPVSSLVALVHPISETCVGMNLEETLVVGMNDAFRGEVFFVAGRAVDVRECIDPKTIWSKGVVEGVCSPGEAANEIRKRMQKNWVCVGNGRDRYPESFLELEDSRFNGFQGQRGVRGSVVGELAWRAWCQKSVPGLKTVVPRYYRASHAEMKLKNGELKWGGFPGPNPR